MTKATFITICSVLILSALCCRATPLPPVKDSVPLVNWNVVLVNDTLVYCYTGTPASATCYTIGRRNTFRPELAKTKKRYGHELSVHLKAAQACSYKAIVDLLDEMTVGNIQRFELVTPTPEEQRAFGIKPRNMEDGSTFFEPTVRAAPAPVPEHLLSLEMRQRGDVLAIYRRKGSAADTLAGAKDPAALKAAIDKAKARTGRDDVLQVEVIGHQDTPFAQFQWVIDALRSRDLYRYQLITIN